VTLGSARFKIKGGKTATVSVKLGAAGRKALKRGKSLKATALATVVDAAGQSHVTSAPITLTG
jgi:hypothetical protein